MKTLKQVIFLVSWQRLAASGGNCSSKGRFYAVADAIVKIPSTKAAHLNRVATSNRTKWKCQSYIRMQKSFSKIKRWNKMTLQDKGRLFVKQYFQLHSNFNSIVNYTRRSEFSGSSLIPIGGIPFFLFDLSRWILCTAWYQSILEG